jgi:hypothetical protein
MEGKSRTDTKVVPKKFDKEKYTIELNAKNAVK